MRTRPVLDTMTWVVRKDEGGTGGHRVKGTSSVSPGKILCPDEYGRGRNVGGVRGVDEFTDGPRNGIGSSGIHRTGTYLSDRIRR